MIRKAERRQRNPAARVVQVLRLMAEGVQRDWGVRELAQQLGLAPSGAHRILVLLEQEGLVASDRGSGRYRAALEFYRMAWRVAASVPISQTALPVMQRLVSICNETAFLGLYDPTRMMMVLAASVESSHELRYVVKLHEWVPIHAGASGLAIMAFLPAEERHVVIARTRLKPFTGRSITNAGQLERELEKIQRQGYAFSHSQRILGAIGLAAPIFGPGARVVGDLILTIPEQRFDPGSEPRLARLLIEYAARITTSVGGQLLELDGARGRRRETPPDRRPERRAAGPRVSP